MKQPVAGAGVQGCGPPKLASAVKPTLGYVVAKLTSAVLIVRSEPAAEDSLADILARIKFGIAMAAMIRMIATTISNSISEKPSALLCCTFDLIFIASILYRNLFWWHNLGHFVVLL